MQRGKGERVLIGFGERGGRRVAIFIEGDRVFRWPRSALSRNRLRAERFLIHEDVRNPTLGRQPRLGAALHRGQLCPRSKGENAICAATSPKICLLRNNGYTLDANPAEPQKHRWNWIFAFVYT